MCNIFPMSSGLQYLSSKAFNFEESDESRYSSSLILKVLTNLGCRKRRLNAAWVMPRLVNNVDNFE
ncbi:hypothetical protein D3C71_2193130 [compost metagenome]